MTSTFYKGTIFAHYKDNFEVLRIVVVFFLFFIIQIIANLDIGLASALITSPLLLANSPIPPPFDSLKAAFVF